jgi:hypothetical protein
MSKNIDNNIHLDNTFALNNEYDLHCKVVDFMKKCYPNVIFIVGLGELQDTGTKRCTAFKKGYRSGQPDMIILKPSQVYSGLGIEFKNPNGKGRLSSKQQEFCNDLQDKSNFKILISNSYDEILQAYDDIKTGKFGHYSD